MRNITGLIITLCLVILAIILIILAVFSILSQTTALNDVCKQIGYDSYNGDNQCISQTSYKDVVMNCDGAIIRHCWILEEASK